MNRYLVFGLTTVLAYFEPLYGLFVLVIGIFVADFFTGWAKSIVITKKIGLLSKKLRWSFVKMVVYLALIAFTFYICSAMEVDWKGAVKIEVWWIIYTEGLSIVENLMVVFPHFSLLRFLHYLLAIEFLKVMPMIANYLKEKEE